MNPLVLVPPDPAAVTTASKQRQPPIGHLSRLNAATFGQSHSISAVTSHLYGQGPCEHHQTDAL